MLLQNESYNKMGLGHCVTDTIIDLLMSFGPKAGIYGARASGGGSGGTICVLCNEEALPVLEGIAAEDKKHRRDPTSQRRFIIADESFNTDNGQMTATLKVRRHVVRNIYGERLAALYPKK